MGGDDEHDDLGDDVGDHDAGELGQEEGPPRWESTWSGNS